MLAQIQGQPFSLMRLAAAQMLTTANSIKDKAGELAQDYVAKDDTETLNAFRRSEVQESLLKDDTVSCA
jgi:hypothetical protein